MSLSFLLKGRDIYAASSAESIYRNQRSIVCRLQHRRASVLSFCFLYGFSAEFTDATLNQFSMFAFVMGMSFSFLI
jgi:hypothetical protein